jgi:acetyl-CoA acetyltransferase family protein
VAADGGLRETSLEELARLEPAFRSSQAGGRVTAGNASQITDGAASVLIMSAERALQLGVAARARLVDFAVVGDDPRLMLTANIPATRKVLGRAGLSLADIDRFEVNEAFASAVLAWIDELGVDDPDLLDRVNVNGGAIALGHPLGASGTRLTATLVNELERIGGRYGLQVMCEGGGMANAMIIERLST